MPAPIDVRCDFTPEALRAIADTLPDRAHARRIRAIAAILEGKSRAEAASIGGMERQTLRDWVHRFNSAGPEGLKNLRPPGRPPKLTAGQQAELAAVISRGPTEASQERWRLADVAREIHERFGIDLDEVSVGRVMKRLGYAYRCADWRLDPASDDAAADDEHVASGAGRQWARPKRSPRSVGKKPNGAGAPRQAPSKTG